MRDNDTGSLQSNLPNNTNNIHNINNNSASIQYATTNLRRPKLVASRTETSIPHQRASKSLLAASSKLLRPIKTGNNHSNNHDAITNNIKEIKAASTSNLMKLGRSELTRGFRDIAVPIEDPIDFNPNLFNISNNSSSNSFTNQNHSTNSSYINILVNPNSVNTYTYGSNIDLSMKHNSDISDNGNDTFVNNNCQDSNNNFSSIKNNDFNQVNRSTAYVDAESLLVDVLPSFEMYNALHRHIPQGNVDPDRHDFPPTYHEQEENVQPNHLHIGAETPFTDNLQSLNTVRYTISNDSPFQDDLNDSDNINIEKLYSLPKLTTSPIDIDIRITKNAAKPHTAKYEEQSMLKEYTNGDIIHGYCIISNHSSHKIKYEMFYVTLEGYISLIDRNEGKRTVKRFLRMVDLSASWSYTDIDVSSGINYTPGERDLYDGTHIGLTNNRTLEPHTKYKKFFMFKLPQQLLDVTCKHEHYSHCLLPPSFGIDKFKNHFKYSGIKINSVLGCGHMGIKGSPILTNDLSNDDMSINYTIDARIVGKDMKTQKLNLLKEKEFNLRIIPFGFTATYASNNNDNSDNMRIQRQLKDLQKLIEERLSALEKIFKKLGLNEPITNSDVHGTDVSGTFDMNTELDSQEILRRKLDQLHVNNRLDDNNYDLSRIKNMSPKANTVEAEISYRYKSRNGKHLSTVKPSISPKNSSNSISTLSKSKSKSRTSTPHIANGFFSTLLGSSSTSSSLSSSYTPSTSSLSLGLSTSTKKSSIDIQRSKGKNYQSNTSNNNDNNNNDNRLMVHDTVTNEHSKHSKSANDTIILSTKDKFSSSTKQKHIISTNHSKENAGLIVLTASIPKQALPYTAPSLLRKSNKFELKNKHDQENWIRLMELVLEEEKTPLKEIPIKLTCILSNNSLPHEPPRVQSISTQLIVITGVSHNSISIKLNTKILMNKEKCDDIKALFKSYRDKIIKYKSKFNENVDKLNELFNIGRTVTTARELQFKDFISPLMLSDIDSIINLEIQRVEINDIFKKQIIDPNNPELEWRTKEDSSNTEFESILKVNLDFNQNVSETIIPNFETCLCCRFYCIRVHVKFDNHIGATHIDIPVNVKKFNL
ncbi:ubiquitin-ubiquitin ligase BUL2 PWA37_001397 [Arxiozyma heterogenica]|uniref:BUL2 n=1 Tax=Arxiozyma heterogenica TaxID=278026 RepID=A0AAN7ZXZ6_9SACH|nr:hypothetical protein RI543_002756 [Kazachstania heterogenica]